MHIPLLTEVMVFQINRLFDVPEQSSAMACLLCMVGLSGTDFCRAMPRVGGKRLWELLQVVAAEERGKLQIFKPPSAAHAMCCEYDEDLICDHIMTKVYGKVFAAHVKGRGQDCKTLQSMSAAIKSDSCKLSSKIKEDFPTMEMAVTTVRNMSWTLGYWTGAVLDKMQAVPDPLHVKYGYVLDAKGRPQWLDIAMREAKRVKREEA